MPAPADRVTVPLNPSDVGYSGTSWSSHGQKNELAPCIRDLRISVESIVRLVAGGWSFEQILESYPDLEREDITQALEYAAAASNVHV